MKILVTGGAGYIGSHTCVELLNEGFEVVVIDNFSNSKSSSLDAIKKITGKDFKFYEIDYLDKDALNKVFEENKIDAVINFAGFKAVGESVQKPIEYYTNNISGALNLLDVMRKHNVKKFVFSSSATVYGNPEKIPLTEDCKIGGTTNPYGTSKLFIEQILKDIYASDNSWDIIILRYFNPVGAHESGLIGEDPKGIPNNLMPYIAKVATKELKELSVFGNDYNTPDGTGVRDYIHVVDLAKGHVLALNKLEKEGKGLFIYNLGTGTGYSVLDLVHAYEKANNVKVPYKIAPRRDGDIATCYSDPTKAKNELGFVATKTIEDMCHDSYKFVTTGGHLKELLQLKKLFGKYDSYLITEKTDSTKKLKDEYKEKMGYMVFGTKDHMLTYPFKLLANCFISVYYFIKIRPKYIVTTGTHTAGPICYLGKIFGSKIIYIETMANINRKTQTGRLIYPIADLFIVQWESMLKIYPKAVYGGFIF